MSDVERLPSNIYPTLTYADAPAAIAWLCRAFGFEARLVVPGPDGTVRHSELSLGPGVIMVSSPKPEARRGPPGELPHHAHAVCVRVDDPDAHCERARAAGARITQEPKDEDYGSRGYLVEDLEGHMWCFGTYSPGAWWDGAEPTCGESP
ncbi:MAG: VOC family protein [Planctomycetota bacterium]